MRSGSTSPTFLHALPLVLSCVVLACLLLPRVQGNPHLLWTFAGVGGGLVVWQGLLWWWARRSGRPLRIEPLVPVRQHYVQACVQTCLYCYWGWFWQEPSGVRPMAAQAPLILAQFAFLYAFDGLFAWTRGKPWRLGSGPTPIVLSTNLFIWFRDDWFVWQFAMLTTGLLGKEFVKWTKDGRRTHVFNPSGFGLACAATVLIVCGASDHTWVNSLASTIDGVPFIYLFLFGLGVVVQHFFAVTLMTFAAAVAMVGANYVYTQCTGVYLFASSNLPAAAFLGLHLLMTDPSTSPRSHLGRTLFGAGYGVGYVIAFQVLGWLGAPELFAKLYPVPVLNLCVQWLDRLARGRGLGRLEQRWQGAWSPRAMNAVHMAVWAGVFAVLYGSGYFDNSRHPGNSIAFWKRAVAEQRPAASRKLVMVAGAQALVGETPAARGQAWNELAILSMTSDVDPASAATRLKSAATRFAEASALGCVEAIDNQVLLFLFHGAHRSDDELNRALKALEAGAVRPGGARAAYLVGLAYETGAGRGRDQKHALELYRRCGDDLLAQKGIARIGLAPGALVDLAAVAPRVAAAATAGDGESCYYLAYMHELGRGVATDAAQARAMFERAAQRGFPPAVDAKLAPGAPLPAWVPPRRKVLPAPPWSSAYPSSS